jgi:hypothetical protein
MQNVDNLAKSSLRAYPRSPCAKPAATIMHFGNGFDTVRAGASYHF